MPIERAIVSYLRATAPLPWVWGGSDCMMWTAGLVRALTGIDPARDLRGAYHDAAGAARAIRREGGALRLMERRLDGPMRREDAAAWGVCLVSHRGRATAGILAAGRVLMKTRTGIMLTHDAPRAAWGF